MSTHTCRHTITNQPESIGVEMIHEARRLEREKTLLDVSHELGKLDSATIAHRSYVAADVAREVKRVAIETVNKMLKEATK